MFYNDYESIVDDGRLRRKDEIREESDILKQLLLHIANCYEQGLHKMTLNRRNPWSELGPLCFLPNQLVDFITRAFKIPPRKTLKCAIFYESFTNISTLANSTANFSVTFFDTWRLPLQGCWRSSLGMRPKACFTLPDSSLCPKIGYPDIFVVSFRLPRKISIQYLKL